MSVKQQFVAAVEELPETVTVEEAFARLVQAFKLKQARRESRRARRPPPALSGTLQIHGDLLEPAIELESWDMLR